MEEKARGLQNRLLIEKKKTNAKYWSATAHARSATLRITYICFD